MLTVQGWGSSGSQRQRALDVLQLRKQVLRQRFKGALSLQKHRVQVGQRHLSHQPQIITKLPVSILPGEPHLLAFMTAQE